MSFASPFRPLVARGARLVQARLILGAAALTAFGIAQAAASAQSPEPADVCAPLKHIVAAPDFRALGSDPAARLPGFDGSDTCRAGARSYDCRWRAHWGVDGVVNDPLQELGADIAACFGNAVHDVNTPYRQHFVVSDGTRRVTIWAGVTGANELRLRVAR